MERMYIKYCGIMANRMVRLLLLFAALFSFIDIKANVVDKIKGLYTYPNIIAGISIDSSVSNGNQIIFKCHIDKESDSYKNWQKSKLDNLRNDSIKHGIEAIYDQNGGNINMDAVDLWGNLYNEDCALFVFFKAQVISDLCARISTYKLEDFYNDCNPQIHFDIYDNATKEVKMFDFTLSSHDIADAFKINKYQGKVYDVLLQKFIMLRGIKLNQKALPIQAGFGVILDSIAIRGNTISYYNGVSDLIADLTSLDDMKQIIEHIQMNLSGLIDNEKFKKAKGFPLLDMRIEYKWYKTSNKQRLCSVTFAYPSLNILSVWPDSMSFDEQTIGFTEEDGETNAIPICLFTPVEMGLSVYWASSNIGAASPYEYGGYYGWGMLSEDIRTMDSDDYPYLSACECITGNPEYDIARNMLGDYWHIPTSKEWKELCNSCVWISTTYNGIEGYKVIGPNGNAIFLPAAGFREGNTNYYKGKSLNYWTSDIDKDSSKRAHFFYHELNSPWPIIDVIPRWRGQSIRPVFAH